MKNRVKSVFFEVIS